MLTPPSFKKLKNLTIALSVTVTTSSFADDDFDYDFVNTNDSGEKTEDFVPAQIGERQVTAGIIQISDDNEQLGRHNGLYDAGTYLNLNFNILNWKRDNHIYYAASGSNLGTDARELQASVGNYGLYHLSLNYDELTTYSTDTGETPFNRQGKNRWLLPEDWQGSNRTDTMTGLSTSLHDFNQKLSRDKWLLRGKSRLTEKWDMSLEFSSEKKAGQQTIGSALFFDASSAYAAQLPNRVDQRTHQGGISIQFNGNKLKASGQYWASRFDNNIEALEWQNPYTGVVFESADYPQGFGRIAASPDNLFQRLRLQGLYTVSTKINVKWDLSSGTMKQDEKLLPYTINSAIATPIELPVKRFDGEVKTTHANIALLASLAQKTRLTMQFVYDERDNRSPRNLYVFVRGDSRAQVPESSGIYNTPTSTTKETMTIQASQRLPKSMRLTLGYDFIRMSRDNASVEESEEDRLRAELRWRIKNATTFSIKYQFRDRNAGTYYYDHSLLSRHTADYINNLPDSLRYRNHPLMQQYYLASREQDQLSIDVNHILNANWSIDFQTNYKNTSYDKTILGLTDQSQYEIVFTSSYQLDQQLSGYLFLSFSDFENEQASLQYRGGIDGVWPDVSYPLSEASDPSNEWYTTLSDSSVSVGIGGQWDIVTEKLSLTIDYLLVDSKSSTDVDSANDTSLLPLPDNDSRLHDLSSRLTYHYDAQVDLYFDYRYYRFEESDWAYDQLEPQSISNLLATGEDLSNESINLFGLSVNYRFE